MSQEQYANFVHTLASELNASKISPPSLPDVVVKVRAALDNPDTTADDLANIIGVDAALASRVLVLANSTYHNPAGIKIESIGAAVGRIGFEKVRTAATAYAVEQLHSADGLEPLRDELRNTWSASLRLAALCEVIARHSTSLDGDNAFIAGLLHRIGVLYIFTKYHDYAELVQDPETRQGLIDEWSAPIGQSIVQNWGFSEDVSNTLNPDEVETTRRRTEPNLADVVTTAKLAMNGIEISLPDTDEAKRLQLTEESVPELEEMFRMNNTEWSEKRSTAAPKSTWQAYETGCNRNSGTAGVTSHKNNHSMDKPIYLPPGPVQCGKLKQAFDFRLTSPPQPSQIRCNKDGYAWVRAVAI